MGSSAKVERPDRGAGFRRPVGRACGSFRLQKSTSGAWHSAPGREERSEAAVSSPASFGSAERKSVGSWIGAAKSRLGGGFAFEIGRAKAGFGRADTRRWKAPGVAGTAGFDEPVGKAVLAVRAALRRTRIATRASKVATFGPPAEDNAAVGGCRLWARLDREPVRIGRHPHLPDRRERATCRLQLMARRQARRDPGRPLGLVSIGRGQLRASAAAISGVE